jgi:hypothetical protein
VKPQAPRSGRCNCLELPTRGFQSAERLAQPLLTYSRTQILAVRPYWTQERRPAGAFLESNALGAGLGRVDHHNPEGVLPFALRRDPAVVPQGNMHDSPLVGGHRSQPNGNPLIG